MYVFFDKNGVIRETVNDKPVRVGSQNANKIYFYFDQVTPYDVFVTIQWSNGDKTPETSILLNQETKEIPYNKNRDLKYFKDYKLYNFYYYEIENVASNGLAEATVRMMEKENSLFAQGLLTFNIENGIIKDDYFINQSQFDYLIKQMGKVDQNSLLAFQKALEVQQIALDKPMVYFENDFKNLVTVLSVSEQAKVGDIFVLLAENQPDFVVISEQSAQRVNYIIISQYDIENDLVPFAEVGKVYKIENSNTFIIAIESGIQKPTVDNALNLYSENPVQNKVLTEKFNELQEEINKDIGQDGKDGVGIQSVTQTTTSTQDSGTNIITVKLTNGNQSTFQVRNGSKGNKGDKGDTGEQGADGYTPVKGKDYFTEADKTEFVELVLEALPNGDEVSY